MEYNNSNANGIIKHICLNGKNFSLFLFVFQRPRKNNKKRFFSLSIFTKVRGCKRKTDVLHLLCVFVIVLFFFSLICAFLSISLLIQANNFENCSFRLFIHIIFFPGYFHHSSNDERCLVKSSYCVELFELVFFSSSFFFSFQSTESTIEKISNRNLINRIWFCFMH